MTVIVEDGTVVANANSYVTAEEFTDFVTARGYTSIAEADGEQQEIALVRAQDYMKQKWRLAWMGSRVEALQSTDWPRRGVPIVDFFDPFYRQVNVPLQFQDTVFIAENQVPQDVKDCQMLLAIATFGGDGTASINLQASYGRKTKREKVGSLEVEYMTSQDGGNTSQTTTYWDAMHIIQPYLRPSQPFTGTVIRS